MLKRFCAFLFLVLGLVPTAISQIIVPLSLPREIAEGKITGWQQGEVIVVSRAGTADVYLRQPASGTIKLLLPNIVASIGSAKPNLFFPGQKALYFFASGADWKLNYNDLKLEKLLATGDEVSFKLWGESQIRRGNVLADRGVNPSADGSREFAQMCIEQPAVTAGTRSSYFTAVFERKVTTPTSIFDKGVVFHQAVPLRPTSTTALRTNWVLNDNTQGITWADYTTLSNGRSAGDWFLVRYDPGNETSKILIRETDTFLGETVRWWDQFADFETSKLYVRYHTPTNQQRLVKFTDGKPMLLASTDMEVEGLGKPSGINGIVAGQTIGLVGVRTTPGRNGFTALGNPEPEVVDTVLFWDPLENKLSRLFQNGDVMPDGKKVVMATRGSGFQLLASTGDCEADILTFKDPQTADGWYRILLACVKKSPATAFAEQEVFLEGKNFAPAGLAGLLTEVLVDGVPLRSSFVKDIKDTKVVVKAPAVLGSHTFQIRVAYGGRISVSNTVTINVVPSPPPPPPPPTPVTVAAVTSLMGELKASFAPGEIITLWGKDMAYAAKTWDGATLPLPTELGCRVTVDVSTNPFVPRVPLSLYYCSANQINAVLSTDLAAGKHTLIVLRLTSSNNAEASSVPVEITVSPVSPTLLGNSIYPVFLQNVTQDPSGNTFVSAATPARASDVLVMYATGLGNTDPPLPKGMAAAAKVIASVEILLQGHTMELLGVSASPQYPGLYQIAFRVAEIQRPNGEPCSLEVRVDGKIVKTINLNLI
jgi:uncharacterized protein (TIGR03437 family)